MYNRKNKRKRILKIKKNNKFNKLKNKHNNNYY